MRKKLTNEEKEIIGLKCCNCGSEEDLQYHHIVPVILGGNDILSNMCCLCYSCHYKVHRGEENKVNNYGELIRKGKEKARKTKPDFKDGKPKKFTKKQLDDALGMLIINGGSNSYNEVVKLLGISKSTLIRENNRRKKLA